MIRIATIDDLDVIADIDAVSFAQDAWPTERFEQDLTSTHRVTFIADDGFALISIVADIIDLERIAVRPHARRLKIATALINAVIDYANDAHAERIILEVAENNEGAHAFYTQMGFTEITRRLGYYPGGINAVVMTKEVIRG